MYEYIWTGFFEYKEGNWFYCDKDKWSISWNTDGTLIKYAKNIKNIWKKIETSLKKGGVNLEKTTQQEFLTWLTDDKFSPPKVNRALAICLKHFASLKQVEEEYTIFTSIVNQCMTVEMRGLGQSKPCWFFLQSNDGDIVSESLAEYVIALPNHFLADTDQFKLQAKNQIDRTSELLKSHRIEQKFSINFGDDKTKVTLINKAKITPYRKGLICGCIPIPGKHDEDKIGAEPSIIKTPEIVMESPNVIDALKYLSQVWQDSFAKSVLISAPPGSGKEQFSNSIPYGTGRVMPDEDTLTLSLSTGERKDLEKQLYGTKKTELGLIAKAKDKVLFLDEVHHPEKEAGIRASLLRPLESDEYTPLESDEPEEVENVLFVLATSKPLKGEKREKGLADIPPPDFWTRMTHVIKIKHPFEGIWDNSLPNIIDKYFKFFWWARLEKYFKIDPETEENQNKESKDKDLALTIRLDQMRQLKDNDKLDDLVKVFHEKLFFVLREERIQPHELSIRGFKNIVTRLFSISVSRVTQGFEFDPQDTEKHMASVIYEIIEIAKLDSQ
jgi:hypothetical protein